MYMNIDIHVIYIYIYIYICKHTMTPASRLLVNIILTHIHTYMHTYANTSMEIVCKVSSPSLATT